MTDARWNGQTHETLYNWINSGQGARAAIPQLEYWKGLQGSLDSISAQLNDSLNKIGASWEGAAGQNAHSGLTPMRQWADAAHQAAGVMHQSAQDQADHISNARAQMPEPVPPTNAAPTSWPVEGAAPHPGAPNPAMAIAKQSADHEHQEQAAGSASERAVQVMNNYQSASHQNVSTLGRFFAPPDLVIDVGDGSITADGHVRSEGNHGFAGPNGQVGPNGQHGFQGTGSGYGAMTNASGGAQSSHVDGAFTNQSNYNSSASATLGGSAALGGIGAQFLPRLAPGGFSGVVAGRGGNSNQDEQERNQGTRPSANTGASQVTNAASANPTQGERGMPPTGAPMGGPGMGAGGAGGGMGGGDTIRGGNPYLANRGLAESNSDPLAAPKEGGYSGNSAGSHQQQHSGGYGDQQAAPRDGGYSTSAPGSTQQQHSGGYGAQQQQPGQQQAPSGYATPDLNHGGAPMMPPPGGGGMGGAAGGGMNGGGDEVHERSSFLVQADNVFDDDEVRVAPPVIGEDWSQ